MAKRKSLSKSIRFEVFKRDCFTCQYCGAKAPDALLEVDHIKPVSKGGTNDILNLITACSDCNRGKSNKELSDKAVVVRQRKQFEEIQNRREMIEMIAEWRSELIKQREKEVDIIEDNFRTVLGVGFTPTGRAKIRDLIGRFGFDAVCEAYDISVNKYETAQEVFDKIGGICHNRKIGRKADYYYGKL